MKGMGERPPRRPLLSRAATVAVAFARFPAVCASAQTSLPWERRAMPRLAAKPVGGARVAHVGLKFRKAMPMDPDLKRDGDDRGTLEGKRQVLSFRGARDVELSASADGDILAHEYLQAWGGPVDRHADPTNLMDERAVGCALAEE